ncbi:MAG: hypothetical protein MUO51_03565 [Woeseiaceae bacterium]|nr:hypothetical protein [Woeseiaceae bacterium]
MLTRLLKSPSVRAAVVYGIGGLGFAIGNMLLAKALPTKEFALVALVIAVAQLTSTVGPLGVDTLVIRYSINLDLRFLARVLVSSTAVAAVSSLIAWSVYGFSTSLLLITFVICVMSSANNVGASIFQSRGKFLEALALTESHNIMIVVAAAVTVMASMNVAFAPLAVIALAYALSAIIAWLGALKLPSVVNTVKITEVPWKEGLTILAIELAVITLIQLERLTIPKLLDYESLATFAILATVAGSPYRVLQMAVNFTLLPRLRQAENVAARRRIAKSEAIIAAFIVAAGSVFVWLLTQPFIEWFLDGRYQISDGLVAAAILAGVAKVVSSFTGTSVTALGNERDLSRLNFFSWIAIAVGLAAAVALAGYGLVGVVLGVSIGWIFLSAVGSLISARYLRTT